MSRNFTGFPKDGVKTNKRREATFKEDKLYSVVV